MRVFTEWERSVLDQIASVKSQGNLKVDTFFNSFYFTEKSGRALILQTQTRYAVFFLKTEIFDNEKQKNEEISKFIGLLSLLKFLALHGYVAFQKPFKGMEKSMYFLQDSFINPVPANGPIVLNNQGMYTAAPDTIHGKDKQVIYRGIVLEQETYELILGCMTGSLIIAEGFPELKWQSPKTKVVDVKKKTPTENRNTPLVIIVFLVLISAFLAWFYISIHKKTDSSLQLGAQLSDSLQHLSVAIKKRDSLYSHQVIQKPGTKRALVHYGIDISKWNGDIRKEIDQVDSIAFVICKATEGLDYVDPQFADNWALLHRRKIIKGAYHFYQAKDDPIRQAEFFLSILNHHGNAEIAPIVDIELESIGQHETADVVKIQINLLLFLTHLEAKTGRIPMIYTGSYFANRYLTHDSFIRYPLWLAEYTNAKYPTIPFTWRNHGFKIWQKSHQYNINSKVFDFDVFFGEKEDLIR